MENPEAEVEAVIYKLTTGSPRLQQQTLEHYFTPNASFSHPFCAVDGNRGRILSIFRWYKVLSPRIDIQVNGIAYTPSRQTLYIDISQTFRLWPLIPFGYRADVNLVTVLQLTRDPSGRDKAATRATVPATSATPSYGSNALPAASTSPFTASGAEKPGATLPSTAQPAKYWIQSQTDLYPVGEFAKFVSLLDLLPWIISLWHALATWCCVLGAAIFAPFTALMQSYSDKGVEHRARVRSDPAFGPSVGGGERQRERDVWELEARFLGGGVEEVGKTEGMKMVMGTEMGRRWTQGNGTVEEEPMLDWMKMEESGRSGS